MGVGRGGRGGLVPSGFWNSKQKKVVLSISRSKKQISSLLAPPGKTFGKIPFWPPPGKNPSDAHGYYSDYRNRDKIRRNSVDCCTPSVAHICERLPAAHVPVWAVHVFQDFNVSAVYVHENYTSSPIQNDIALVKLASPDSTCVFFRFILSRFVLDQWFSTWGLWPPERPWIISEGPRVDILCTQLYYICFIRVIDGDRWVIVGCYNAGMGTLLTSTGRVKCGI